jgi:hypothetical protein
MMPKASRLPDCASGRSWRQESIPDSRIVAECHAGDPRIGFDELMGIQVDTGARFEVVDSTVGNWVFVLYRSMSAVSTILLRKGTQVLVRS